MVFPEIAPFARTGDLADVGSALPRILKDMGHDVRLITPQYRMTNERKYVLRDVIRLQNIEVPLGKERLKINVKSAFLPNSKVQVYFIDYKPFFFREGIYRNPRNGLEYPDNDKRFILFSKGVLQTLVKLQWQPDVIHCHDWQTGMIPFLLKSSYADDPFFKKIFSLFTVHDFKKQGQFNSDCIAQMVMDREQDEVQRKDGGKCSFLKTGLEFADVVSTVSENYVKEISSDSVFDPSLPELLKSRKDSLYGISHGIDTAFWNPEDDPSITAHYSVSHLEGKSENKKTLMERFGIPFSAKRPVIAMVSDLTEEKGTGLVAESIGEIMKMDVVLVLQGSGDKAFQKFFAAAVRKYRERIVLQADRDQDLTRHILAGSDIVLVPSKNEPCSLLPLAGMRYGAVPFVSKTGGFVDTVVPFSPSTGKGTGFHFPVSDRGQFIRTLNRIVTLYGNQNVWQKIVKNGMREDLSWNTPAKKYIQLYHRCAMKRK